MRYCDGGIGENVAVACHFHHPRHEFHQSHAHHHAHVAEDDRNHHRLGQHQLHYLVRLRTYGAPDAYLACSLLHGNHHDV